MLRIELLPDYIGDKNKIRNLGLVWAGIVVLALFGLLAMNSSASRANDQAKQDRADKEALKKKTDDTNTAINQEKSARAIIESKQKFVLNSQLYNDGWAEAFETIRDVKPSDNSIILNSMALDTAKRQVVSLTGFGSDEKAIVRWWMSLRNNTALFDHVNFDLVPHQYAPVDQASNGGGMGRPGGGSGGMGMPGMPGMASGRSAGGMGGGSGGGMPGMPGGMSGGSGGMGGMGGGGATAGNGPADLEGHHGLNFTASVVLRTALAGGIATPSWPSAGGGGGGGMGGMGGGMSGGMSGGMPSAASGGMRPGGA